MKIYEGKRQGQKVTVQVDGRPLDARLDLRDFHASGFEWGYEGSGPSQLALAILADHADARTALGNYRRFTQIFLADMDGDHWQLRGDDIDRRIRETTVVPMDLKTLIRKVKGEI